MHMFIQDDFKRWMKQRDIREYIIEKVNEYEKEKSEVDKKHDKIFKKILSNKKEAVRVINKNLI